MLLGWGLYLGEPLAKQGVVSLAASGRIGTHEAWPSERQALPLLSLPAVPRLLG